jgi:hypothetical protein
MASRRTMRWTGCYRRTRDREVRQVAMIDAQGNVMAHTAPGATGGWDTWWGTISPCRLI